jgi:hypothetical protein
LVRKPESQSDRGKIQPQEQARRMILGTHSYQKTAAVVRLAIALRLPMHKRWLCG